MRLICLFVLIFLSISSPVKSQDNVTSKYPTRVIYQSMIGCYQGTHRWIVLSNPSLIGVTPPQQAQEKMTAHCFCVTDRVRNLMTFEDYMLKSGASGSFMVYRSNKKDDELGIDEL